MGILVLIQLLGFLLGCVHWGALGGSSPFPAQAESLFICIGGGFVLGLERSQSILLGRSELMRGVRVAMVHKLNLSPFCWTGSQFDNVKIKL